MRPPPRDAPCPCGAARTFAECHGRDLATPPSDAPAATRSIAPGRFSSVLSAMRALPPTDATPPVMVVEGFLSDAECEALVACFERNTDRLDATAADPYWRARLLYYQALAHEPEARAIMRRARDGFHRELRAFYRIDEPLYADTVHLVRWREGQSMAPHADNARDDGTPNEFPWRRWATVLYLNEAYEGGELYFPRTGRAMRPRRGTLVGFHGGPEHTHGVRTVLRGVRYTMPAWHGTDATKRDRDLDG